MKGLGTIINAAAVLLGGGLGLLLRRGLKERFRKILMDSMGIAILFLGLAGALEGLLRAFPDGSIHAGRSLILIGSLLLGSLCGELLRLEQGLERFGLMLRRRFRSEGDDGFLSGFLTASLTICVGAMAVLGSLRDGLSGDWSTLAAKGLLDLVIVMIYASSLGRGVLFSVIPLVILQGSMTALAGLLAPLFSEAVILGLSFVGSVLVFCVGVNLLVPGRLRVANMLPSLIFAAFAMAL